MNTTPERPQADEPGEEAPVEAVSVEDRLQPVIAQLAALEQRGLSGASWFFWVAGLSLVNSAIILSGGNTFFVIGLGVTLIADSIANAIGAEQPEIATAVKAVVFGFDLIVAAVLCLFGWLSRRGNLIVLAIGMALYLLDGLIFVLFQDWMSVAFHGFALWCMWSGFTAFRQLKAFQADLELQVAALPAGAQGGAAQDFNS